jgi:hypothetical protein
MTVSRPASRNGTRRAARPAHLHHGQRVLMKGNEAIAEAAIRAGCDGYFGYPITPQAELLEWMARRMPEEGRAFVQAESELGAVNMALGAAATGARILVSSSSPGMSLMAEAMSYMAASELPVVVVNVMRGGPGLGSIGPSQSDYFQAVKGHGHGDYRVPVLAPASISEAMALTADAFELAERYRTPVIILTDGILGQAMEPVELAFRDPPRVAADWALGGADGRAPRVVRSLHLKPEDLELHNNHLQAKFAAIAEREVASRSSASTTPISSSSPTGPPPASPGPRSRGRAPTASGSGSSGRSRSGRFRRMRCATWPSASAACSWWSSPRARWSRTCASPWRAARRSRSPAGPAGWSRRPMRSSPRSASCRP